MTGESPKTSLIIGGSELKKALALELICTRMIQEIDVATTFLAEQLNFTGKALSFSKACASTAGWA